MESTLEFIKYAIFTIAIFMGMVISLGIGFHEKLNFIKAKLDEMDKKDN